MKSIEIQKNSYLVVPKTLTNSLLICGVFSSLLYAAMNIICAMQ